MAPDRKSVAYSLAKTLRESQMRAWLNSFAAHGNVSLACRDAGIARDTYYSWIDKSRDERDEYRLDGVPFHALAEHAAADAADALEAEVRRRAVDGYDEPVFYQGKPVGAVRKFSDLLLIFLTKKANPAFRDNYKVDHVHSGR